MLRYVVEKELKDCLYGSRSLAVFVLSVALFAVAVYTGGRQYEASLQEYRTAQESLQHSLADGATLDGLSTFPFNFVKPPAVLSILVGGADFYAPRVYNLNLYQAPSPRGSPSGEDPARGVFGALDLTFIVEVVLGLGALLFTFSAICGEKEAGTLKLQLANALPRDSLLVGKLIGNLLGLLVPVALAFLASLLMLAVFAGVSMNGALLERIVLLALNYFLYLTVLFALGLCISAFTARSTTAFAMCLVGWVLLAAIMPKLATIAATQLSPVESVQSFEIKKADVDRRGTVELEAAYAKYAQEHGGHGPSGAATDDILRAVREDQNRELALIEDDYERSRERQARLSLALSRLSPAGSAAYAAMSLASTDLERDFRFREALRRYRSQFAVYYDRKTHEFEQSGASAAQLHHFTDIPPFDFPPEPASAAFDRAVPDLGFLALWALALFVVAYIRFLKYDVR